MTMLCKKVNKLAILKKWSEKFQLNIYRSDSIFACMTKLKEKKLDIWKSDKNIKDFVLMIRHVLFG